jgi:hypothetical protein
MGIFAKKFGGGNTSDSGKVTPPDAPASDPAKNANPVEGKDVPPAAAEKVRRQLVQPLETKKEETKAEAPQEVTKVESKADKLRREAAEAIAQAEAEEKAEAAAAAKKLEDAKKAEEKAEEKKRGPGRPPGAKNTSTLAKEAREALAENGPMFSKTTVSYGVTMNMGDFNSVRIDVAHTVEYVDGDADEAFKLAVRKAKEQVTAELDELQNEKK